MIAHISFKTCSNPTNDPPPFPFTHQILPGILPHWCSSWESFVQRAQDETLNSKRWECSEQLNLWWEQWSVRVCHPWMWGPIGGLWSSYVVVHLVLKIKSILQCGTTKSSLKKLCFMAVVPFSHSLIILPKTGRGNGLLGAEKGLLTHVITDNHNLENSMSLWDRFCTQTGRLALPLCPLYSLAL